MIDAGHDWGRIELGAGHRVQVEFVSANPTGPLQVGNGRGAVLGDALAAVLDAAGFEVEREYYVNDAGTQIRLFGRTLFARYQQQFGREVPLPDGGYQGAYMIDLAARLKDESGDRWLDTADDPPEELAERGLQLMVDQIRDDLALLRVEFNNWQRESALYNGADGESTYDIAMDKLRDGAYVIEKDGAVWFRSEDLGEDKDNVLIRSSGEPTYFASDVAYHFDKFLNRSFDTVIDVWGADHQGHVARTKAAVTAVGGDGEALEVLLYQLVHPPPRRRARPHVQTHRGDRHPPRADRRSRRRRRPLLHAPALRRRPDGLRPRRRGPPPTRARIPPPTSNTPTPAAPASCATHPTLAWPPHPII